MTIEELQQHQQLAKATIETALKTLYDQLPPGADVMLDFHNEYQDERRAPVWTDIRIRIMLG